MFHDYYAEIKFSELQRQFGFQTVIETGTHEGYGARHLAKYCDLVFSIEVNDEFYHKTVARLLDDGFVVDDGESKEITLTKQYRRICLLHGHSATWIRVILERKLAGVLCFYLDAHWGGCPLLEELDVIAKAGISNCVIIIHDFKVPDRDFGYDEYEGRPLDYAYVKDALAKINSKFNISYNRECAPFSNTRGILYATP